MNRPMKTIRYVIALLCVVGPPAVGAEVDFRQEVLPILAENCFECHGPDAAERKADLRLDIAGGEKHWSELLERVSSSDSDAVMPPAETGKKLKAAEIETLRRWIDAGANYEAHWAFLPILAKNPPSVGAEHLGAVDRFVIARLREKGLELSAPVSRQKLIRRATFDLTGLPPTWAEVKAFVEDTSPEAFAKVVDRLLESPEYGERWGRHWLDLARYADTHGGGATGATRFPFSFTYRDYVIAAFNADVPYDRFILEQLAADQLNLDPNDPALAGLGFLTVGRQYRNRHDLLDDQIDVITRGLLGLTVACARCHDHKFDTIPATDYYSLHATLSPSTRPLKQPLVGDPPINKAYRSELKRRELNRDDMAREQGQVMRGRLRMQVGMYLRELAKGVPEQDTSTTFLSYRTEDLRPVVLERWRAYLKDKGDADPVFGPWHKLSNLDSAGYADNCQALLAELKKENGDPKKFADDYKFSIGAPRWNPKVLDALVAAKPQSFVEVADVYGKVFADVQRRWMNSLLAATEEAFPGNARVKDEDKQHRVVNSAIERQLRHHLYHPESPTMLKFEDRFTMMMINRGVRDKVIGGFTGIDRLNLNRNAPPRSMTLRESVEAPDAFVFLRGSPIARGERVEPRFIGVLSEAKSDVFVPGKRRLGLAASVVASPLARRVIVNWVWQHHFGRGLVRTPDDFGTRGDPPTHPELLDHLADQLLKDGWSLKQLHRRIMLTKVYQQAAIERRDARESDPDNRLLWRMPTRKLELEAMRDSMLAVSGELQLEPRPGGRSFEEKGGKAVPRRSVYAFVNRDVRSRMDTTFDGADPSACTVKRPQTMVPQQTLFALNSAYIQDRANALAKQPAIRKAKSDEERARLIYQTVYSREPEADEITTAVEYVEAAEGTNVAWSRFVHVLLAANEFHFVD